MKVLELFGGIGACTAALKRIGANPQVVDYVEIDKYAVKSYNAINGTNFEPQDITKWDKDINVDLIMHGSPCQDFSIVGNQAGGDEGSGTRSSLMYETVRIVEKLRPKYVIWENVKNILSKTHKHNFDNYIKELSELGYTSYYQVLNAKDFGIPQNRERVLTISVLEDQDFQFPQKITTPSIKQFLDQEVSKEYYLSEHFLEQIKNTKFSVDNHKENTFALINKEITGFRIIDYRYDEGLRIRKNNLCPTLTARGKGSLSGVPILYLDGDLRFITPKECWRLMGFSDEAFDKAAKVNSNAQLYKQAGNSIVVNVLAQLFTNLLKLEEDENVKKVEEKKVIKYETDKMIDLESLREKEPELFDDLATDYPVEHNVSIIINVEKGE